MNTSRKTVLACLVAGLCSSAWAQQVPPPPNPFVTHATSPGFASVGAPSTTSPSTLGMPKPANALGIPENLQPPSNAQAQEQAVRDAFGITQHKPLHAPEPIQPPVQQPSLIEKAAPGQTLQAPALPNMPPVPIIGTQPSMPLPIQAQFNALQMSESDVKAQTQPVNSLKFTVKQGSTYRMTLSSVAPNMVQTPFEHPKLLVADQRAVNFFQHGRALLVTVANGAPIGAYLTGQDPNDPMIALVFQPKPVPPQNYEMAVEGVVVKQHNADHVTTITGTSEEHTQRVVHMLEQAIQNHIPDGFGALSSHHWPQARSQAGLLIAPRLVLSSGSEMVDVFEVNNQTAHAVQLEENDFYQQGVEGVALSQHTPLEPGQSLKAYILRRASHADANDTLLSVSRP